jgi:hypothetical protein
VSEEFTATHAQNEDKQETGAGTGIQTAGAKRIWTHEEEMKVVPVLN